MFNELLSKHSSNLFINEYNTLIVANLKKNNIHLRHKVDT